MSRQATTSFIEGASETRASALVFLIGIFPGKRHPKTMVASSSEYPSGIIRHLPHGQQVNPMHIIILVVVVFLFLAWLLPPWMTIGGLVVATCYAIWTR
jgi:hypothetical protein